MISTSNALSLPGIMDGWMIERCPLSAYGCEHYQIRIQPKGGKQEVGLKKIYISIVIVMNIALPLETTGKLVK